MRKFQKFNWGGWSSRVSAADEKENEDFQGVNNFVYNA